MAAPQPKQSEYLPQRRKGRKEIVIRTWRSSRLGGRNLRIREFPALAEFAQAAKTLNHNSREFAEIGEFVNQELFTPRPLRLGGAISESCFTGKPEDPKL